MKKIKRFLMIRKALFIIWVIDVIIAWLSYKNARLDSKIALMKDRNENL